jgi:hypothetical protein
MRPTPEQVLRNPVADPACGLSAPSFRFGWALPHTNWAFTIEGWAGAAVTAHQMSVIAVLEAGITPI